MRSNELYRFYDANGALLYVGITDSMSRRMAEHRDDKPWWQDVEVIRIERHPTREDLALAEFEAIQKERPRYNQTHAVVNPNLKAAPARVPRRMWRDVSRFTAPEDFESADDGHVPRGGEAGIHLPCPGCGVQALVRLCDEYLRPVDDNVRCLICHHRCTMDDVVRWDSV